MPLWHLPTPLKERGDLHPNPYGPSRLAPVSNCNLPVAMIIPLHSPIAYEAWSLKLGGATSVPQSQGRGSADLESLHPGGLELGTSAPIPNVTV